jgi:hypothetical protein
VTTTTEPTNDLVSVRAAVAFLGVFTMVALGCATWLESVGEGPDVLWALLGAGVGALATLATTRLGGTTTQQLPE